MRSSARMGFFIVGILALSCFVPPHLWAQPAGVTLSGRVTGPSQAPVIHANVSVKNLATSQSTETQTDLAGRYRIPNLAPGDYEVSVSADAFQTKVAAVTLVPGAGRTMDLTLSPAAAQPGGLSLADLGISPAEAKGSPEEQAMLDKRTHMLQVHQRLGLITAAPLLATVITSFSAKTGRPTQANPTASPSATGRDIHAVLGAVTAGMYVTTAYFAIRAPKVPGTEPHGHIRLHRALAWVHGPGMVLTPVLGAMAFSQASRGQRVHGIASMHSQAAIATFGAYAGAMLSVSIK
jgi:carboxypeptidase family protein